MEVKTTQDNARPFKRNLRQLKKFKPFDRTWDKFRKLSEASLEKTDSRPFETTQDNFRGPQNYLRGNKTISEEIKTIGKEVKKTKEHLRGQFDTIQDHLRQLEITQDNLRHINTI